MERGEERREDNERKEREREKEKAARRRPLNEVPKVIHNVFRIITTASLREESLFLLKESCIVYKREESGFFVSMALNLPPTQVFPVALTFR